MNYNRKVDDRIFNGVKTLLKSGASQRQVGEYMQISSWTVGMIGRCETLDEYRLMMEQRRLENAEKKKAKKAPPEPEQTSMALNPDVWAVKPDEVIQDMKLPGGTMSATYQFNRMIEAMKKQSELLELISNKLAFIVEMLS